MVCAVCGDKSVQFHYGVLCCPGCKAFFRRTIRAKATYVCPHGDHCEISAKYRACCRACRFTKCIDAGMDPRALQSDRGRIGQKHRSSLQNEIVNPGSPPIAPISPPPEDQSFEAIQSHTVTLTSSLTTMPLKELLQSAAKHYKIVIRLMVESRESVRREASRILHQELITCPGGVVQTDITGFAKADTVTMEHQMRAQLIAVVSNAQKCVHFQMLPRTDQMTLLRAYAPDTMLYSSMLSTAPFSGDFVMLIDGIHIIPRKASNASILNNIVDIILDELVPKFREVSPDAAEYSCIRALSLWNADLLISPEGRALAERIQQTVLVALEKHIGDKELQHESVAVRLGKLLLLSVSVQNAAHHMRKCFQIAKQLKLVTVDEFLEELFEDITPTTVCTDTVLIAATKALRQREAIESVQLPIAMPPWQAGGISGEKAFGLSQTSRMQIVPYCGDQRAMLCCDAAGTHVQASDCRIW